MTEPATLQYHKTLHQLHHEIQNCLSVISVGADVLEKARNDDALFAEFCEAIQEKRRMATQLVDEFLKTACQGCKSINGS